MTIDEAGPWTLQVKQAGVPIGKTRSFDVDTVDRDIWQQLTVVLRWSGGCVVALYFAACSFLLWRCHRSVTALRMLMDPAWGAKPLTWPFLLLRHVPAVQCWVLEPWFQNVRRSMASRTPAFVDPAARGPEDRPLEASGLLAELENVHRVWLQGPTGMVKSAVFAAWGRAYYNEPDLRSLADAAHKYGFILVTLQVRH